MTTLQDPTRKPSFKQFYRSHFLDEHRHPANRMLHIIGTVASVALVVWALATGQSWWLLAYPLVHAAPGLLGHRLYERNAAVGDVRVLRQDFPPLWFIAANHRLTFDAIVGLFGGRQRST